MSFRQFILAIVVIAVLFFGGFFLLTQKSLNFEVIFTEKTKVFSFLKPNSSSKNLYNENKSTGSEKAFMRIGADPPSATVSFLDGDSVINFPENVYVVMIDNHRIARKHHTGINNASIVFEMPTEGGIPRLAAVFSSHKNLEKIGPIRSVRPYFLDVIKPFSPIIIHAGGSDVAMAYLYSSTDFCDMDHNEGSEYFWREKNIMKPHNLFTNTEKIALYAEDKNCHKPLEKSVFELASAYFQGEDVVKLEVDFGTQVNKVIWNWDEEKQLFVRYQQDENEEIGVDNVIVIISNQWLLGDDDKARIGIITKGEGSAFVFRDGKVIEGKWTREENDFFKFFDLENNSIPLVKGKIFFEFISEKQKLSITKKDES